MHKPTALCTLVVSLGLSLWGNSVQAEDELAKPAATKSAPAKTTQSKSSADVVYVATPHDVVAKMLELARVQKEDVVYDLGCGDGRVVITAAKKYGCRGIGFDIDAARVAESRENCRKQKVEERVTIEQKNIFEADLSPASVITLYLLPKLNVQLIPQLEKLKPGSRIVSHDFDMQGVTPDKVVTITSKEDGVEHHIYLWTIPLKKVSP